VGRPVVVASGALGSVDSSSLVKVGKTTVAVRLSAGKNTIQQKSVAMADWLTQLFSKSGLLDLEQLCILPEKAVWVLYYYLLVLDYDGNLTDAATLAAVRAAQHVVLPSTQVQDGVVYLCDESKVENDSIVSLGAKLRVNYIAIPVTLALIDQYLIADPTAEEEELMSTQCTIILNEKHDLISLYKPGGSPLTTDQLKQCLDIAKKRVHQILSVM